MVNRLIGFGAKRAAAAGGGADLTFIGSTTNSGSGYSVSFHGSAATGDLAIVGECFDDTTALTGTTATAPTGWTLFDDTVTVSINYRGPKDQQCGMYYKVLTSGDISTGSVSSQITAGGDELLGMVCQIWRPVSTPTLSVQEVTSSIAAETSVTSSSGTPPCLVVGVVAGSFGGLQSPAFDQVAEVANNVALGVTFYAASPVDQTVDDNGTTADESNFAAYANLSFA